MDDADTVHAEAAREMVAHNDWVTLRINGDANNDGFRYLEKAPLMYWCVAASFKLFGVHDWSARLPIALGMLALLLVVYRIGAQFLRRRRRPLCRAGSGHGLWTVYLYAVHDPGNAGRAVAGDWL